MIPTPDQSTDRKGARRAFIHFSLEELLLTESTSNTYQKNHSSYLPQPSGDLTTARHHLFPHASPALSKPFLHSEKYFVSERPFYTLVKSKVYRLSLPHLPLFEPPSLW